jgi:stearoyl-CoA desaturase (delta-9 desaturase)
MRDGVYKAYIAFVVVGPLVGLAFALVLLWNKYVFVGDLALLAVFYALGTIGVSIGYHRMLTHEGFRAPEWLRALFMVLGCMAVAGARPDGWAATHIKHHAHSDEDDDPHSPLHGFWHAHFGWLFSLNSFGTVQQYAPQFLQDRTLMLVSRLWWLWGSLSFLLPFALGGWTGLLWGGVVRLALFQHVMWSVNSICHTFGKRPFATTDESRNEWLIGLLAFGEGWHNNHHAFPRSAFHGMRWWQFDLSGLLIAALERVGLVWDVQRVSMETQDQHRSRAKAMIDAVAELRQTVLASIAASRRELADTAGRFLVASLSEEHRAHCKQLQQQAVQKLDSMMETISLSAHLKRQKLLQYQREAQRILADSKQKFAVVVGEMVVG